MRRCLLALFFLAATTACEPPSTTGFSAAQSASLLPKDSKIAETYTRSCKSCHINAGTSAPLTGDAGAWDERFDKGMPALLDNVINGYEGMPPLGLCMDCSADEFEALILFMAGRE